MKKTLNKIVLLLLLLVLAKYFPWLVDNVYDTVVYPLIRNIDLFFYRWIPFSVGDVIYLLTPFWIIYRLYLRYRSKAVWRDYLKEILEIILIVTGYFYLAWGLNYFRLPLSEKTGLHTRPVKQNELAILTNRIIDSVNTYQLILTGDSAKAVRKTFPLLHLQKEATDIYEQNAPVYPFLSETFYVVKPSMLTGFVSGQSILGYFNPFTHEAQINTAYPGVFRPHIVLHELAHQIGFAREDEAEFIAFWEAVNSRNNYFKYAAYLTATDYLLRRWYRIHPEKFDRFIHKLNGGVRKNLQNAYDFVEKHRSRTDFSPGYDKFLKLNGGKGLVSYGMMIRYLRAYYHIGKD